MAVRTRTSSSPAKQPKSAAKPKPKTRAKPAAPVVIDDSTDGNRADEDEYLAELAQLDQELADIERKLRTGRKLTKIKVDILKERRMVNAAKREAARERYERKLVRRLEERDQRLADQLASGRGNGAASPEVKLPYKPSREAN